MIAFERKRFLKALKNVETRFQRRLKELQGLASDSQKQGMELILKQCNILFREEWATIVNQYNEMRDSLFTVEQSLFLTECQKFYIETENAELKSFI